MTFAKLGAGTLLVLACLLWLLLVATVATLNSSDPAGNALSYSYAVLMTIALWILLGAVLLVARSRGAIPGWIGLGALVLFPLSGAAAVAAVDLLQGRVDVLAKWPIVIPVLAPLLILLPAAWSLFPGFRPAVPANTTTVAWTVILILSLMPWPAVYLRSRNNSARADAGRVAAAEVAARERQENLDRFNRLTPKSPLWEWLQFTTDGNELRDSAFAGIRGLPRRQADAEELIARGEELPMMELPRLDVAMTPRFCEVAREFLRRDAESLRPGPDDPTRSGAIPFRIERHLPTIRWLTDHGCDCEAAVTAYEASARRYPDSPQRAQFLEKLAQLRQRPNGSTRHNGAPAVKPPSTESRVR